MALPKVNTPTYELTIPSSGEKVSYRPFLVKEEKTLLMAMESGDNASLTKAMKDIISSCTDGKVNTKDLAPFDLEYFFLQLRGRSIGDVIDINIPRPANFTSCCEEASEDDTCSVSIKIDDITVDTSAIIDSNIILTDDISIKMRFPQVDEIQKFQVEGGKAETSQVFKMVIECIEYISDGEDIYKTKDHSKKEINDFIESLNTNQFNKIRDYFEAMPRLTHELTWTCNKCKKTTELTLQGIDSFFG